MEKDLSLTGNMKAVRKIPIARNIKFQFRDKESGYILPVHYVKNNPILTHYVNAMHILFPDGERFFIDSVKYFQKRIQNPELKEAVDKFVYQEAIHNREHQAVWDHLEKQGLKPMRMINWLRKYWWSRTRIDNFPEKKREGIAKASLAATAAGEHFTVMAAIVLLSEKFYTEEGELKGVDKEIENLMVWHGIEEIEHKDVAFDVMKEMQISNALKNKVYKRVTKVIALCFIVVTAYFYILDKKKRWRDFPKHYRESKKWIVWSMGVVRSVNPHWDAKKLWNSYLAEDFHPNNDQELKGLYDKMLKMSEGWMKEKMKAA